MYATASFHSATFPASETTPTSTFSSIDFPHQYRYAITVEVYLIIYSFYLVYYC